MSFPTRPRLMNSPYKPRNAVRTNVTQFSLRPM